VDADRRVLREVGEAVVGRRRLHDPGPGVVRDPVTRHVSVRTRHSVARDRHEHDARVDLAQLLEAEASPVETARPHPFDHCVGAPDELAEGVLSRFRAEIEHHAAFAPADVEEQQRHAFDDGPRHPPPVVALRRLDLDDLRAEVGEMGRQGAGPEHRDLDDP
jgi:hypothetical protein